MTGTLPELEDTLVALHLAVLAARPMDARGRPGAGLRPEEQGPRATRG